MHMSLVVFMGSTKYPDENAFDSYINKYGGHDNAFTECERVSAGNGVTSSYWHSGLYCLYTSIEIALPHLIINNHRQRILPRGSGICVY